MTNTPAQPPQPAESVQPTDSPAPLLEMRDVHIAFSSSTGLVEAVRGVNMTIYPGQSVAIVGESGSGKSTTAMSILGLLPGTGRVTEGQILFEGQDITGLDHKGFEKLRGNRIGLVPQDPMSNLNPVWRVGTQIEESLMANDIGDKASRKNRVTEILEEAGLPDAERRARQYPHEFSGGMRQRALIGMGLAAQPTLLIADEPTSALDVTVQKQILDRLDTLTQELGNAVLFITHDLGLAAERAEHLLVMHRGRVVESGPSQDVLTDPQHPYTQRLVDAAPSLSAGSGTTDRGRLEAQENGVVISARNLTKEFPARGRAQKEEDKVFRAVDNVSFDVHRGTTLALVGESGSGKSTVANMVLDLLEPTSGTVHVDGKTPPSSGERSCWTSAARYRWSSKTPTARWTRRFRSTPASKNRSRCTRSATEKNASSALQICWTWSLCHDLSCGATPMSFPADSASASPSPVRLPCSRRYSSWTKRSRPSTSWSSTRFWNFSMISNAT